jgi:hypothetical protein
MNQHANATRTGNSNAMLVMIMLLVITAAFAFLAYNAQKNTIEIAKGQRGGALQISPENSLESLHETIESKQQERNKLLVKQRELRDRLRRVELILAGLGLYRNESGWTHDDTQAIRTRWTSTRETIEAQREILDLWDRYYADASGTKFARLRETIREGEDYKENIQRLIGDEEDSFNSKRDRLIAEQDHLREQMEALSKDHRTTYAELSIKKNKLERQIRDLLELELEWLEYLEPDGEVLELVRNGEYVIINLGSSDQLSPGMRFEIFTWEKGQHVTKGLCEVIDVGSSVTTCRIIADYTDERHPVVRGDKVGNPVYDRTRSHTFVLAGEFQSFNRSDLAKFIERMGGMVRDTLGPSVDYLVAGDRSEAQQDAAREYRVVAMTEDQLIHFLETTFKPEVE